MQQQFLYKFAINLRHMRWSTKTRTGSWTKFESETETVTLLRLHLGNLLSTFRLSVQPSGYILVLAAAAEDDSKDLLGNANKLQIHSVDRLKCKLSGSFGSCVPNSLAQISFLFFLFFK